MSFPTIHASWLGAMSYASPAPISVPIPPVSTTCMRPDSRTVRVPPSEESERPVRSRGPHRRLLRVDGRGAFQAPKRCQRDALLIGQRDWRADLDPEAGAVLFDDDPSDLLVEASAESGSGVFSAISGLREPTDDPVGPVLRDDRDPADAPVRKAAPVGRQRMVAPNEVQDRGFEPCPQRRALGPRFEQGAVVFVAPLFIAVAVLLEGDRQVIGVTGIGTHDLPPLARRPHSAGTANERRARSQEGTSPPGPLATL